ncbi:hypothetical protein BDW59DRAFT_138242 [Aspergillus cavernicola]|uniref:Uncharacterized protein n=1 Tax=Aspergillus cavernicola TaxID=176166 RepID=A0ABR4J4A7_9EURO
MTEQRWSAPLQTPLALSIIRQKDAGYHWVVCLGPILVMGTADWTSTERWTLIDVHSKPDGFTTYVETGGANWVDYRNDCEYIKSIGNIPGMTEADMEDVKQMVVAAVKKATDQKDKRWVSVFMRELVDLGWVTEDKKLEIECAINVSPYENGYGYA